MLTHQREHDNEGLRQGRGEKVRAGCYLTGMGKINIGLIEGDGIGPEICRSLVKVFEAGRFPVNFINLEAGLKAIEREGSGIGAETLAKLRDLKVAIKGPTETPVGGGHKSVNVTIRKALDLYINLRPVQSLKCLETPFKDVNLLIVRENIEDTYAGIEHRQSLDVVQCLRLITRSGSERCHRFAFETAKKLGRKKVTCGHKANIMKMSDGLFLECFKEEAARNPDLPSGDIIVDNLCMQLVSKPQQFDVLVLPNLFGDIVSDLCAGLVGGLGIASGANIGANCAVFEAVHGSAPDIAGQNKANPSALLFSAVTMLQHLNLSSEATRLESALHKTLEQKNTRTRDLGGTLGTNEFTDALIQAIKS